MLLFCWQKLVSAICPEKNLYAVNEILLKIDKARMSRGLGMLRKNLVWRVSQYATSLANAFWRLASLFFWCELLLVAMILIQRDYCESKLVILWGWAD